MQLADILKDDRIALDVEAQDWKEAVVKVGEVLVKAGTIEESYIDAMLKTVRELGAYICLAPHVAMPHARPEDGVKEMSLGLVRLSTPVEFGSKHNDPVDIVFALAALDHEGHVSLLKELADFLGNADNTEKLRRAKTKEEVREVFREARNSKLTA